jgi:hypothetical protein
VYLEHHVILCKDPALMIGMHPGCPAASSGSSPACPSPGRRARRLETGGWIYRDESVQMTQQLYGRKTGILGGSGNLVFNRFTGPGRVGIQSACVHLPTDS